MRTEVRRSLKIMFAEAAIRGTISTLTDDKIQSAVKQAQESYYKLSPDVTKLEESLSSAGATNTVAGDNLRNAVQTLDLAVKGFLSSEQAVLKGIATDQVTFLGSEGLNSAEIEPMKNELYRLIFFACKDTQRALFGGAVVGDPMISLVVRAHEKHLRKYKGCDLAYSDN